MCGISGYTQSPSIRLDPVQLQKMAHSMRNRGPDIQQTYVNAHHGLAHARLRVIDRNPHADQPMLSALKDLALVFNGEIYNYRELRSELEQKGILFKTQSDTEVLLHAYATWGEECVLRLNGMFAFAISDLRQPSTPKLFLARDRFGIKPLFYSVQQGSLAFGSELKPLFELPWIERRLNRNAVLSFLKFSHVPAPDTLIQAIHQLEPAHCLMFEDKKAVIKRYWELPQESPSVLVLSRGELVGRTQELLEQAVKRQLVADVPVGCFLSGGIDSSLLALFSKSQAASLQSFCVGYSVSEFDESNEARQVANHLGLDHHEISLGPEDYLAMIPKLPEWVDHPVADPTLLPSLGLARQTRGSVTVALSGDGGDELFWGYPYQRALKELNPMRSLPGALRKPLSALMIQALHVFPSQRSYQFRKALDLFQFDSDLELIRFFIGTFGPLPVARLRSLLQFGQEAEIQFLPNDTESIQDLPWDNQIQTAFLKSFLPETVLAKSDRAAMAFGLETRVPFLDHDLVDFALQIPVALKSTNPRSKWILKDILHGYVPDKIVNRPKQGFSFPLRDWIRGPFKEIWSDTLAANALRSSTVWNAQAVDQLLREHLTTQANHSHLLFSILQLELWIKHYGVQP